MKKLGLAFLVTLSMTSPVLADACTDLVKRAELGLSMEDLSTTERTQYQDMLGIGKAGDTAACSAATTGSLQSPKPAGHRCNNGVSSV